MKLTLRQLLLGSFIIVVTVVSSLDMHLAWAASCAEHKAVQLPVSDIGQQGQTMAVPPSLHQRTQPAPSTLLWEKGLISLLFIVVGVGLALQARRRQASPPQLPASPGMLQDIASSSFTAPTTA